MLTVDLRHRIPQLCVIVFFSIDFCFRMSLPFLVSFTAFLFIFEAAYLLCYLYSASAPAFEGEPMFELSLGRLIHIVLYSCLDG